ncbi:5-formyltetrahydrofolate cyclo-ligase [Halomonas sp. ATBC28]|jgi:5-formyltetrahydrofolate cyclo-ligase|uniref:5-formyltetrahydrofolate cyclo-ligase n=2 Tax=Vreelandella titanicae TaxID=664683 RepID=L9UE49_9GAMM|nr:MULTISPECIES: 5-formyltetrahydrofolate cyclo-ligase [Halomonas]NAO98307.1 5-formyltetrahydrofolate cyclo-ligase [Halomonas sp. MG34]QGQ68975.1 5-formyltetrahydrofolate cyclo-ligase [Halomonas sp. PA16-9]ELY22926.1 5-formyltetrahydrofolate cyclo-ligase [Halomonas titanicae BH1]MCD1585989.1 5-formyltetrahydrofolate cyclo-ligase [Halomonas sp. IOP_14]MCE7517982.1 5-formyltetrahydrofolate cyclo-ligase [Halomonas titanicae]|tara:strand:- start:1108 stop:1764 length:657 start_codon:yes stop_codon:yes gene_type:complete
MESLYLDDDKRALRRSLRHQRRALSEHEQRLAAQRLCQRLKTLPEIRRARRLSLYLPVNGEIDPTPLIPWLRQRNVNIYLPVLRPFSANRLWFVAYRPDTPMIKNRFGIWEPDVRFSAQRRNRLPTWALDTLIVPLVGFDANANRMGMGGGFYDRSLAFMHRPGPSPTLIGVAHACQQVASLPVEPWDVPLQVVVSDQGYVRRQSLSLKTGHKKGLTP